MPVPIRSFINVALLGVLALVPTACGGGEVTQEEFVDHALEVSAVANDGDSARIRSVFECMWPGVSKDQELLDEFMDADSVEGGLSAKLSKLSLECVTGSVSTTTAPPTTATTTAPTTIP